MNQSDTSKFDEIALIQKFERDIQIGRDALLEAKHRIITLEQKLRLFLSCIIVLIIGALCYGTVQIWQTSQWLKDFASYVRNDRDPKWESWIHDMRMNQEVIKTQIQQLDPRNLKYYKQ